MGSMQVYTKVGAEKQIGTFAFSICAKIKTLSSNNQQKFSTRNLNLHKYL
jgi:hypothetical protein